MVDFSHKEKMLHRFLLQRSKAKWLKKGDDNTAYFYASIKKRREENRIVHFINERGELIEDYSEVVKHFVNHFRSYMGSDHLATKNVDFSNLKGNKLSLDMQVSMLKPFTRKEIKKALFSIPSSKSPGPDGFNSEFFKSMWPEIGEEFCLAILSFFESGNIPKEFNETAISLIPKTDNPSNAIDYRPIACCSTVYKCISKLICLRLAKALPFVINQNQGAFIQNRSIAHNILIFQDLIKNYGRKNTSARCAIKIDLSKAYDTVNWNFLENWLNFLCFPSRFVKWIMVCIRGTSYNLMLNGRLQGSFEGKKGLRQGDPMSPLLFVLVMEFLTRRLHKETEMETFRYHPLCKKLDLVNLSFADDLLLFSKGTQAAVNHLKNALDDFCNQIGLNVNLAKSQIFFGGVQADERKEIAQVIGLEEGKFPLKYLGVPLRPTKWKMEDCGVILDKIKKHLHNWAAKHLSYAGRMQLIQTIPVGTGGNSAISDQFLAQRSLSKAIRGKIKAARLYNSLINADDCLNTSAVWCKLSLPKHRFLLWQVVNCQLLTGDQLPRFNIFIVNSSQSMSWVLEIESHKHLFFDALLFGKIILCNI
uniref:Reverse transcriptase domain-containing protein n=1 Tax=Cannabis sativa TaxID=3483 RepID=A0A803Q9E6_CANSA